ncbi:hypothetical protein GFB56_13585 [Ensifer sp. T173]|jgi:hypothetical protein|uniref:DNA-directed RNA polymerase n=1 Tax=Ensifer canadensis TaxID=555315 RepID=A0AAW4FLP5_9HYPH|nr:hypothetical protein [Ensifer canadensis]MBM3091843.1 hypothetical protein [Ensifer canadensis]UBI77937.1 hypothetical protein J3R84_25730 [Ensifer canadensis]
MDGEKLEEDGYLKVETIFSKHAEAPFVLDFAVVLRRYPEHDDTPDQLSHTSKAFSSNLDISRMMTSGISMSSTSGANTPP